MTKVLYLRISPDLYELLRDFAVERGKYMSTLATEMLEAAVDAELNKPAGVGSSDTNTSNPGSAMAPAAPSSSPLAKLYPLRTIIDIDEHGFEILECGHRRRPPAYDVFTKGQQRRCTDCRDESRDSAAAPKSTKPPRKGKGT